MVWSTKLRFQKRGWGLSSLEEGRLSGGRVHLGKGATPWAGSHGPGPGGQDWGAVGEVGGHTFVFAASDLLREPCEPQVNSPAEQQNNTELFLWRLVLSPLLPPELTPFQHFIRFF